MQRDASGKGRQGDQQMHGEVAAARCHPHPRKGGWWWWHVSRRPEPCWQDGEIRNLTCIALGLEIPLGSGCCMHHHS